MRALVALIVCLLCVEASVTFCAVKKTCLEIPARDHRHHIVEYTCKGVGRNAVVSYEVSSLGCKGNPKFAVSLGDKHGNIAAGDRVSNFVIPRSGDFTLTVKCDDLLWACHVNVAISYTKSTPDAPEQVAGRNVTATGFFIQWLEPANTHGGPVDLYNVTATSSVAAFSLATPEKVAEFSNLQPGTEYSVVVRAHNDVGWSLASIPVEISTPDSTTSSSSTGTSTTGTGTGGSTTGAFPSDKTKIVIHGAANETAAAQFSPQPFLEALGALMDVPGGTLNLVGWSVVPYDNVMVGTVARGDLEGARGSATDEGWAVGHVGDGVALMGGRGSAGGTLEGSGAGDMAAEGGTTSADVALIGGRGSADVSPGAGGAVIVARRHPSIDSPPGLSYLFALELSAQPSKEVEKGCSTLAAFVEGGGVLNSVHLQSVSVNAVNVPAGDEPSGMGTTTKVILIACGSATVLSVLVCLGCELILRHRLAADERRPVETLRRTPAEPRAVSIENPDSEPLLPPDVGGVNPSAEYVPGAGREARRRGFRRQCMALSAVAVVVVVAVAVGVSLKVLLTHAPAPDEPPPDMQGGVPGTPARPFGLAVGTTEVVLAWSAPANGGSQILQYQVQYAVGDGPSHFLNATACSRLPALATMSCTVKGLQAQTVYLFRVAAKNSNGVSGWSPTHAEMTMPPSAPGVPSGLFLIDTSKTSVEIGWRSPTDNGGAQITCYLVEAAPYPDGKYGPPRKGATLNATLGGLGTAEKYLVRVSAQNKVGLSAWSAPMQVSTDAANATIPEAPSSLHVTHRRPQSVSLAWKAPASDGGATVLRYELEDKAGGSSSAAPFQTVFSGNALNGSTPSKLMPSSTYTFRVRAVNSIGPSSWSPLVSTKTLPPSAPCVPETPTVKSVTGQSVQIVWKATCDNGKAIDAYVGRHNGWLFDKPLTEMYSGKAAQWNASDLMPATTYSFDVAAHNSLGVGNFTAPITFSTSPLGGCGNSADVVVFKAQRLNFKPRVKKCGIDNPTSEEKFIECVMRVMGISHSCAECFVLQGYCIEKHCTSECALTPNSQKCLDCGMKYCFMPLVDCSGIPACAWPSSTTPCSII